MFDLDDTLMTTGSPVSERVMAALMAARGAGYLLSICSGRPLCLVERHLLASGVMDYAVCANGAQIVRLSDGVTLLKRSLSVDDTLVCHHLLAPFKPAWNAFIDDHAYFEWKGASYLLTGRTGALARERSRISAGRMHFMRRVAKRGMRFVVDRFTNESHHQVMSIRPYLRRARDGVYKIGCSIPDADACARAAHLLASDGRFEIACMGASELEVTAAGVTKASGALVLMEVIGVNPTCAIAFGDGGNDLPLVDVVGRFVAMGNADEEVRRAASDVCPPVYEDGVACWIEEMLAHTQTTIDTSS